MTQFYVYGYFDAQSGVPFYIGKGKGSRCDHHMREAANPNSRDPNKHKIRKIRKHLQCGIKPVVKIIDKNLTEAVAFELECFLIAEIGRADLGKGPLTNLSDGGEGLTGLVRDLHGEKNPNYGKRGESAIWWGKSHAEETKEKIASAQRGRELTQAHKEALRKPKSEAGRAALALARKTSTYRPSTETRAKLSAAGKGRPSHLKGKTLSADHRAKIGAAGKGVPKPKVKCSHCEMVGAMNVMKRFHFDNCKEKA